MDRDTVPLYIVVDDGSFTYTCVICGGGLSSNTSKRRIPDPLCFSCYDTWKDHLSEPWLKQLEKSRRTEAQRRSRRMKQNRNYELISLDALKESGLELSKTI